jgi:hypothetical protein
LVFLTAPDFGAAWLIVTIEGFESQRTPLSRAGMLPARDFPSCADIESKPRVALGEVARETR